MMDMSIHHYLLWHRRLTGNYLMVNAFEWMNLTWTINETTHWKIISAFSYSHRDGTWNMTKKQSTNMLWKQDIYFKFIYNVENECFAQTILSFKILRDVIEVQIICWQLFRIFVYQKLPLTTQQYLAISFNYMLPATMIKNKTCICSW